MHGWVSATTSTLFGRPMSTVTIFSESDERQRNEKQLMRQNPSPKNDINPIELQREPGHSFFYKGIQVVFVSR